MEIINDAGHQSDPHSTEIGFIKAKLPSKVSSFFKKYQESTKASNPFLFNQDLFDLEDFCRSILKSKPFANFKTIHLFIHTKGDKVSLHHEISKKKNIVSTQKVSEFNSLFQSIKKSRNRSFGQSKLTGFDFDILGTFLGHEFSDKDHNFIFIISRNDFLPQEEYEKEAFVNLVNSIPYALSYILQYQKIHSDLEIIQDTIHFFPTPINVFIDESNPLGTEKHPVNNPVSFRSGKISIDIETEDDIDFIHKEKVLLLGELLNTLKHELANPIFGLSLTSGILGSTLTDPENIEMVEEIKQSLSRSQNILNNFTDLFIESDLRDTSIRELISEVFTLSKSESRSVARQINFSSGDDIQIKCNTTWLFQIFFNLILNASQALKKHETKNPKIKISIKENTDTIEIDIFDNGPGISPEVIENIFIPFFTTKEKGTGLGLSISYNLSKKLGGSLDLVSSNESGTHFKLKLPNYENTNS